MNEFAGAARPLTSEGFEEARHSLNIPAPTLWAVMAVETRNCGFLPDRRPQILFERHVFHKRTMGRHDATAPAISSSEPGGYAGGSGEYPRLADAMTLDRDAALESTSWGLGQVMGFNAQMLRYPSVQEMVRGFCESEDAQLEGVRRFVAGNDALSAALCAKNWAGVASIYNGPSFASNAYDRKLEEADLFYTTHGLPDLEIRSAQLRLTFLGFDPHGVDGVVGERTRAAVIAFQKQQGLSVTGELDDETKQALQAAAGV
jgi:N-acetylmuramidase/Putative peptidoglycan binding domain